MHSQVSTKLDNRLTAVLGKGAGISPPVPDSLMLGTQSFCRLEKARNQACGQQMSKCPARTWFNPATWNKTSPLCSCSSPAFTAQHASWKTPTVAGPVLSLQKRMLVNSTSATAWEGWATKEEHFMQTFSAKPTGSVLIPVSPLRSICNCATVNYAKSTFISKKTQKQSIHLNGGKPSAYLCFVCCGSLQGESPLRNHCHGADLPQHICSHTAHSIFCNPSKAVFTIFSFTICKVWIPDACQLSNQSGGKCTIKTINIWSLRLSINTEDQPECVVKVNLRASIRTFSLHTS